MKITSFSLNNFAPEEFFGGAKSVSMNGPKFSKSDRTMKAFSFVERNYNLDKRLLRGDMTKRAEKWPVIG